MISLGGVGNITELSKDFNEYVREYNAMVNKYIFCYWPWFDNGENKSIDDLEKYLLNALLVKLFLAFKLYFLAFHNHLPEFQ